jgi:hypothetical protein
MLRNSFKVLTLLLVVSLFLPATAFAAEEAPAVAAAAGACTEYDTTRKSVDDKIKQLEALGGGVKPFLTRLEQIESTANRADAAKYLKSLENSLDEQLKAVKELRAPKPVGSVAKTVARPKGVQTGLDNRNSAIEQLLAQYMKSPSSVSTQSLNLASFQGTADDYVNMVAKDLISRELGGLGVPCKGPFRLERFRNLQRIKELKDQGKEYRNFLSYHNHTEEVAQGAKDDSGRVPELSQRVRYLEQQLGLSPLTSSLSASALLR